MTEQDDFIRRERMINILDPLRKNTTYITKTLEELQKDVDKSTSALKDITHEQYYEIYNLSGSEKRTEFEVSRIRVMKKEAEITDKEKFLIEKENELIARELELNKKERKFGYRSPSQDSIFDQNQQQKEQTVVISESQRGKLSKSPSSYQPYNYNGRADQTNENSNNYDIPLSYQIANGNLTEEEAIEIALNRSSEVKLSVLDDAFKKLDKEIENKVTDIKSIPTLSIPINRYDHLPNRPIEATDEILDKCYDYLFKRDFDGFKKYLGSNEIQLKALTWIRNLDYEGTTLKQMLITKPTYIHKCLREE